MIDYNYVVNLSWEGLEAMKKNLKNNYVQNGNIRHVTVLAAAGIHGSVKHTNMIISYQQ